MGEKTETEKEGIWNVGIQQEPGGFSDDGCFINYITQIKYSPEKGKVASWDMGQDANFYLDGEAVDSKISDSFEFL